MKNFFKENDDLVPFTKSLICIFSLICAFSILITLAFSFGSLGAGKKDSSFIFFVFIMYYQLFLLMISFLTLTILLPRWMTLLIGGIITLSPITFLNYQDGLGWAIHIIISFIGVAYIVSKFYENNVQQGDFWIFKGFTCFLSGLDLLITATNFGSLNLTYLRHDLMHQIMIIGLTISMLIGLALIMVQLFFPIKKLWEYVVFFGLIFISIMDLVYLKSSLFHLFLTMTISLIFLSYITFFQNKKYHNL